MSRRRLLVAIALVAAGCNALTGVGDLNVAAPSDAGLPEAAPSEDAVAPVGDSGTDGQVSEADASVDDAADEDSAVTPTLPRSCLGVQKTVMGAKSGTYEIDPDGPGGAGAYSVFCDLTTLGGGWTEIYRWTDELSSATVGYTSGSPALMSAVTSVLIAHRDSTGTVVSNYASFAIPNEWRTVPPFEDADSDLPVTASINGAAAATQILHFGYDDFDTTCQGDWLAGDGSSYGRVCIEDTAAPFFNGFDQDDADHCSLSNQNYDAEPCSESLAFSIAVK